jgi:AcrR family transcriptional regulator
VSERSPRTEHPTDRLREAALAAFAEHGYHGAGVRDIAERAGMSVAALYHRAPSKLALLLALMTRVMEDLLAATDAALAAAGDDPEARFVAAVDTHVRFHTERRTESYVADNEIHRLRGPERADQVARRDRHAHRLTALVDDGVAAGAFATPHPRTAARSILTAGVAVATWYRPDGPLGPDAIVAEHRRLALLQVEARSVVTSR